jgi:hypothetical protein
MKIKKINIPRDGLLKHKGGLKITNIKDIEIPDEMASTIADILAQEEGISLLHKERQASLLRLNDNKETPNA